MTLYSTSLIENETTIYQFIPADRQGRRFFDIVVICSFIAFINGFVPCLPLNSTNPAVNVQVRRNWEGNY